MLILFFFGLTNNLLYAQSLDAKLQMYSHQILDSLKLFKEIDADNDSLLLEYKNSIFSRNLSPSIDKKIIFFEIGVISAHAKKYLAVLNNKHLHIYKSEDFLTDFSDINMRIKSIKGELCKSSEIISLLDKIVDIYKENINSSKEFKIIQE